MRRVRLNPACAAAQALHTRPKWVPQVLTSQELDRWTLEVEGDVPADAYRNTIIENFNPFRHRTQQATETAL